MNLQELNVDNLRFYLDGEGGFVNTVYELLFSRVNRILVRDPNPKSRVLPVTLPASALKAVASARVKAWCPIRTVPSSGTVC